MNIWDTEYNNKIFFIYLSEHWKYHLSNNRVIVSWLFFENFNVFVIETV